MSLDIDVDIVNDTTSNIVATQLVRREDPILDLANEWKVGVTRFYIPSDAITPFHTSNDMSSHVAGIIFPSIEQQTNVNQIVPMYSQALFQSNTTADFINNLNLTIKKSYYTVMKYICQISGNTHGQVVTVNDELDFLLDSTQTFTVSTSASCSGLYGIKLTLNSIVASDFA